jgi:Ca2+-binding EF-hand superfamily protein
MREENLRNAFMMFDSDNSGKIDGNEIKTLLEGDDLKDHLTSD